MTDDGKRTRSESPEPYRCRAVIRETGDDRTSPAAAMFTTSVFLFSMNGIFILLLKTGNDPEMRCCCGALPIAAALSGWYLFQHIVRPTRRGWLILYDNRLYFRPFFGREVIIALAAVSHVTRQRRYILVWRANHRVFYFSCSRLHGEDIYDEILARLDALGVEATSYQRRR